MRPQSIPADTASEVFEVLVERWRSMSTSDRVELVDQISADVELLAITGIRARSPGLSQAQVRHELARRRFGSTLADAAYRHELG